eukprot:9054370-Lingulodinium_polyedra.AAC.1
MMRNRPQLQPSRPMFSADTLEPGSFMVQAGGETNRAIVIDAPGQTPESPVAAYLFGASGWHSEPD